MLADKGKNNMNTKRRSMPTVFATNQTGFSNRIAVVLFAAASLWPTSALPQTASAAQRFQATDTTGEVAPMVLPLGVSNARVKVVVTLSSDSVASARARTVDHKISDDERHSVENQASAQHAATEPAIVARNGKVLARYKSALNGLKIEIDRNQIAAIAALPGVVKVAPVVTHKLLNSVSVPFLGTPAAWQGVHGFRGEGVKIAIVDTGIDYTHAAFGGPGTTAAFATAAATSTSAANPALFGPGAAKVKGGIDLVGDAYDAGNPSSVPISDSNPLDCNGHGTHVAATAAGFGIAANGATFAGPYDSSTYSQNFKVGPGVAPRADIYAVRVFGCDGSTNVVTDAIDWAVQNDMDVISMSLGSDFGTSDSSDAIAAENAAKAGIIVVAASGNAGSAPYITSSPASGNGVISVAAMDSTASFPGAVMQPNTGVSFKTLNANGATLPSGVLSVYVLRTSTGAVSLGCSEADYVGANITGKLVVTLRGTCARVDRATFGQRHGAAAIAMINNAADYPPYEGDIANVTIPFLGVLPANAAALTGAASVTLASTTIANPSFEKVASFSSGGPRYGDSNYKPNVSGPGVSIASAAIGSGTGAIRESGTSMATPHLAGVAALALQAHPSWDQRSVSASIIQSADPLQLVGYSPRLEGAGLVQPARATGTQAIVMGHDGARDSLSFGFAELYKDFKATQELKVRNLGNSSITFKITTTPVAGAPHTISIDQTTLVAGGKEDVDLKVTLLVPASTAGNAAKYREVAGYLTLTPASPAMNNGVSLHLPYYLVPRVRSRVVATINESFGPSKPSSSVKLINAAGAIPGNADFYAWGLSGTPQGVKYFDTRAVGVQSFPRTATDQLLVFAINTFERYSSAATAEFDISIDVDGDGNADFIVFSYDYGALTAGSFNGQVASFLYNTHTGRISVRYLAEAPTDSSTILLPVRASDLGINAANPRFTYTAQTYNLWDGTSSALPGVASFNAYTPSISNGQYETVAPNASASVAVSIDPVEWAKTPALGLMVVVEDNGIGSDQARLLKAGK
jgi:subtilisin family serine protease